MTIKVAEKDEVVYQQRLENGESMNKVVAHLMAQTKGNEQNTTIQNNGHDLSFRTAPLDIGILVRVVNNIVVRAPRGAKPEAV